MRLSHSPARTAARFDDPNLVSHAGLAPLIRLTEQIGLGQLADHWLKVPGPTGANAGAKTTSIVAGMAAGADSITDLDLLRHGAMPQLFTQIKAPTTLGNFLRGLCWGDVSSLQAAARRALTRLAEHAPLLPDADQLAFVDIDSKTTRVYGRAKHGAAFGHAHLLGLDFQAVTLTTPTAAPVILETRLRGGNADSARGADSLITQGLATARACRATGLVVVRADSRFHNAKFIAACRAAGAHFSVTLPLRAGAIAAIAAIPDTAWASIKYPRAIYDADTDTWTSHAQVAETRYTAFTNVTQNPGLKTEARLIVRRVLAHDQPAGQDALFPVYRYHAVFTDSPFDMLTAEARHRDHAGAIEQVFADLNDSALAHFPSGKFAANAAWLALAALAHNLTRAVGCVAGGKHAKARTGTLRRQLITVAGRVSHSARTLTLHLPRAWPWQQAWQRVFDHAHAPPPAV
jgi:hypothetical protein